MASSKGTHTLKLDATTAAVLVVVIALAAAGHSQQSRWAHLDTIRSAILREDVYVDTSPLAKEQTAASIPELGPVVGETRIPSLPLPGVVAEKDSEWEHTVVKRSIKGVRPAWFEVDYPSDWAVNRLDRGIVFQSAPFSPVPPKDGYAKVEILISARDDVRNVPTAAAESSTTLGGQPATRYDFGNGHDAMSLIKAEREGIHYLVWASAVGVSDQHVLQQYRDTMNRIVASIAFVPSTVDPLTWDVAHVVQAVGPATGFSVWHPQGFTVDIDQLEGTLTVASGESNDRYSAGQLSIVVRPGAVHRADLWDDATPLPYRLLGHEARIVHEATTASGHRTDYAIAVGAGTWQVSVTTPLLETASDTSWLYDQTAWFILKNAAVFYDHPQAGASDYPGPP